jgi:hypothetical protein
MFMKKKPKDKDIDLIRPGHTATDIIATPSVVNRADVLELIAERNQLRTLLEDMGKDYGKLNQAILEMDPFYNFTTMQRSRSYGNKSETIAEMKKALEFYADEKSHWSIAGLDSGIALDKGQQAKSVLERASSSDAYNSFRDYFMTQQKIIWAQPAYTAWSGVWK